MRSLAVRTGWARTVQHAACSQVGTVESGVGETGAALNHSVRSMKNECSKQPKAIHKRVRSRLGSQLARESGVISGGASIEGGLEPAPAAGRSQLQAGVVRGTGCEVLEPSEPGPRAWKECAGGTRLTKTRPARRRRRKTLAEDTVELLDGRRRERRGPEIRARGTPAHWSKSLELAWIAGWGGWRPWSTWSLSWQCCAARLLHQSKLSQQMRCLREAKAPTHRLPAHDR